MSTNDPEFYQAPKFTPEPPAAVPRQRGCFFYGCIIASVLALLVAIMVAIGVYIGYRFLNQLVEEYTATAPRELPKVEMPAEQRQTLKDRVEAFRKAVKEGTPTEPLVLTSDDLNALIEEEPELKGQDLRQDRGRQDQGTGQHSTREARPVGMVRGRYLNGEADVKASLSDGVLIVTLDSIEVNGKKPPEQVMTESGKQNLAKDVYKDPKNAEMIRKLESLEVKDGKIILKVRAKSEASPSGPSRQGRAVETDIPQGRAGEDRNTQGARPNLLRPSAGSEVRIDSRDPGEGRGHAFGRMRSSTAHARMNRSLR